MESSPGGLRQHAPVCTHGNGQTGVCLGICRFDAPNRPTSLTTDGAGHAPPLFHAPGGETCVLQLSCSRRFPEMMKPRGNSDRPKKTSSGLPGWEDNARPAKQRKDTASGSGSEEAALQACWGSELTTTHPWGPTLNYNLLLLLGQVCRGLTVLLCFILHV